MKLIFNCLIFFVFQHRNLIILLDIVSRLFVVLYVREAIPTVLVALPGNKNYCGNTSGGSKTQVTGQVTGQVNRKNIFLPRKLTIFNSKLTRYEKESVIMRGIVYFKLQDVALRD